MKILVAIRHTFPFETPYALRVNALITALKGKNTEFVVLCDSLSGNLGIERVGKYSLYHGDKIYSLEKSYKGYRKILKLPRDYSQVLEEVIITENPDIIISSSLYDRFYYILKLSRKYKLPVILESCEWFDPSTFKGGRLSHHYVMFLFSWKYLYPKVDGVIAISRLLENHYKKYVCNVLRVPTILDTNSIVPTRTVNFNSKIRLLFAGSLARTKDSLKSFFEAFDILGARSEEFEVCICGVDIIELQEHLGYDLYSRYKKAIINKGRIPQKSIADEYRQSHFGIFMRPVQRSSNAGFSTKLGEGMSLGTPFIVNDTSDISLYIENEKNGFIVEAAPSKIANVYSIILSLTKQQYFDLRSNARITAESYFNCMRYSSDLKQFVNRTIKGAQDE